MRALLIESYRAPTVPSTPDGALLDEAFARNPAHPGWCHTAPALNFYRQGRYADALEQAKQIDAPGWVHNHTILAMIYSQLGQEEQARAAARQVLQMDPDFEQHAWYELHLRNFPEQMAEHMIDGLRKAGLNIPARPRQRNGPSSQSRSPRESVSCCRTIGTT